MDTYYTCEAVNQVPGVSMILKIALGVQNELRCPGKYFDNETVPVSCIKYVIWN